MRSNCSNIKAVMSPCATVISLFMCLNNPRKQEMYKLPTACTYSSSKSPMILRTPQPKEVYTSNNSKFNLV